MQPPRRKTPLLFSEAFVSMKHYGGGGGGRKNNNLPAFVVVFSIFLFGCFMYNEDVKSIAEFPFSTGAPKGQETKGSKSIHQDSPVQETSGREESGGSLPVQENNIDGDDGGSLPVVKNARTIVETEVEGSYSSDRENLQSTLPLTLKSSVGKEKEDEEEDEKKEEGEERKEDEDDNDDEDKEMEAKKVDSAMSAEEEEEDEEEVDLPPESCDLFTGEWVFDNSSHPLYREDQCEFLTAQVTCLRNGRKDSLYQYWKWQPRDCSLPKSV